MSSTPVNRVGIISVACAVLAVVVLLGGLLSMGALDSSTLMYELLNSGPSSFVVPAMLSSGIAAFVAVVAGHVALRRTVQGRGATIVGMLVGYVLLGGLVVLCILVFVIRFLVELFW